MVQDGKFGVLYVKHLNNIESSQIDIKRDFYFKKARHKGIKTLAEREVEIIEEGEWSAEKNKQLENLREYISRLRDTKKQMLKFSDREEIDKRISDKEKDFERLEREKLIAIKMTCEAYASKRVNEDYIYNSLFKDGELKEPFFSKEEFEDLSQNDLNGLIVLYNMHVENFGVYNLKKLALSSHFLNYFHLCSDNPFTFYGKPVVELTFYQAEVFSLGRYFKHILEESDEKPHEDVLNDPDLLIEWWEVTQNNKKLQEKTGRKVKGTGGRGKQEEEKSVDHNELAKKAREKGGSLNMKELMKLQGV